MQAYCTPPESNLLSWLDNVFIGFQVLDSFFSFSSPINIVEFNEKLTVASPCKSLEGRLIESGKTFSFYISEPLHYVLLFLYIYVLPHMLLISFTIVNMYRFCSCWREKKTLTNAAYVNLTGGLFVGTTTKLQSYSINSSFFFTKTQYQ